MSLLRLGRLSQRSDSADQLPDTGAPDVGASTVPAQALSVAQLVWLIRPCAPVYCLRPGVLEREASSFIEQFPGQVLYAVKSNPEAEVIAALHSGGVRHFDVASLEEIRSMRSLQPSADLHFMHPVKTSQAIATAYRDHRVRNFALDSKQELDKIIFVLGLTERPRAGAGARARNCVPGDLGLLIRMAIPGMWSVMDLSGKFGCQPDEAVELLKLACPWARRLGICFHVGSQCLQPQAYRVGLELAKEVACRAGISLDVIDLGGGFPVTYHNSQPPELSDYFALIKHAQRELGLTCQLWCEPGRALVATGISLVVQIIHRRRYDLFLNDGAYGALSENRHTGFQLPARLIRAHPSAGGSLEHAKFRFFGPTCDSFDCLAGPFVLPEDAAPGDWIELGLLGAYSSCQRSTFNGFGMAYLAEVSDPPLLAARRMQE